MIEDSNLVPNVIQLFINKQCKNFVQSHGLSQGAGGNTECPKRRKLREGEMLDHDNMITFLYSYYVSNINVLSMLQADVAIVLRD